jgi:hypothetical protein
MRGYSESLFQHCLLILQRLPSPYLSSFIRKQPPNSLLGRPIAPSTPFSFLGDFCRVGHIFFRR